jgi:hypothetical protein
MGDYLRTSADPGLILKPDLDRRRLEQAFQMSLQRAREILWNGPPLAGNVKPLRPPRQSRGLSR